VKIIRKAAVVFQTYTRITEVIYSQK
jgi:hypothetical protein